VYNTEKGTCIAPNKLPKDIPANPNATLPSHFITANSTILASCETEIYAPFRNANYVLTSQLNRPGRPNNAATASTTTSRLYDAITTAVRNFTVGELDSRKATVAPHLLFSAGKIRSALFGRAQDVHRHYASFITQATREVLILLYTWTPADSESRDIMRKAFLELDAKAKTLNRRIAVRIVWYGLGGGNGYLNNIVLINLPAPP
jgi:hypothetical protein